MLELKHKVSDLLGIDVPQQRLLLTGKTLAGKYTQLSVSCVIVIFITDYLFDIS